MASLIKLCGPMKLILNFQVLWIGKTVSTIQQKIPMSWISQGLQFGQVFHVKGHLDLFFFHTTVTHDLYLNVLRDTVLPQLHRQHDNDDFFFHQDRAPPHHAITLCMLLDEQLPNRWIGRRGPVEWPPRSPDLTPMDFFIWSVVKDKFFSWKPLTVDDMIHCIR